MTINKNKTKVMVLGQEQDAMDIRIYGVNIEEVTSFKYLGVVIENNGGQETEINSIIENTLKMYYAMNKSFINKKKLEEKRK